MVGKRPRHLVEAVYCVNTGELQYVHADRAGQFAPAAAYIKGFCSIEYVDFGKAFKAKYLGCQEMVVHMVVSIKYLIFCARASQLCKAARRFPASGRSDPSLRALTIVSAKLLGSSGFAKSTSRSETISRIEGRSEATIGVPEERYSKSLTGEVSTRDASSLAVFGSTSTSAERRYIGTRSGVWCAIKCIRANRRFAMYACKAPRSSSVPPRK